jgi:hypothetical protein
MEGLRSANRFGPSGRKPSIDAFTFDLVDLYDVAFRIVEKDLLPATHRPSAVVGVCDTVVFEALLEGFDVVGAVGRPCIELS